MHLFTSVCICLPCVHLFFGCFSCNVSENTCVLTLFLSRAKPRLKVSCNILAAMVSKDPTCVRQERSLEDNQMCGTENETLRGPPQHSENQRRTTAQRWADHRRTYARTTGYEKHSECATHKRVRGQSRQPLKQQNSMKLQIKEKIKQQKRPNPRKHEKTKNKQKNDVWKNTYPSIPSKGTKNNKKKHSKMLTSVTSN